MTCHRHFSVGECGIRVASTNSEIHRRWTVKAIFMPLIVANREHLERSWSKDKFPQLELPAERSEMLPDFSLVLSRVEKPTRGIVELGLPETQNTRGKADRASLRDFRVK